jgi:hypothetical protein
MDRTPTASPGSTTGAPCGRRSRPTRRPSSDNMNDQGVKEFLYKDKC